MTTRADLTIPAGTDWGIECELLADGQPANLAGYTITARFARAQGAVSRLTLTLGNGLTVAGRGVRVALAPAQSRALLAALGTSGWWQLDVTGPGGRERPYEGAVTLTGEIRDG